MMSLSRLLPPLAIATPAFWRHRAYLDAVAKVAQSHLGVAQPRPGRYGAAVCAIISEAPGVDCDRYEAWCQRFAWACCETAAMAQGGHTAYPHAWGGVMRAWHEAGVLGLRRMTYGAWLDGEEPGPGWVMVRVRDATRRAAAMRGTPTPGHCGVVEVVRGATVGTIDGNTNASGSATGGEVGRNVVRRDDARLVGFIEPKVRS